ncbi:MAG: hypothetical protein QW478_15750 [Candidatus Micrarchaeaceae archaeon]
MVEIDKIFDCDEITVSDIITYVKDNFTYSYSDEKGDYYTPKQSIYISCFNPEDETIYDAKVIQFLIQHNLKMYRFFDFKYRFRTFYLSEDHKLLVYDTLNQTKVRLAVSDLLKDKSRYNLLQFLNGKITMINLNELYIEFDEDVTEGGTYITRYDYTINVEIDGIIC